MAKRVLVFLTFALGVGPLFAERIEIPAGGYAIEAGADARTTMKSGSGKPPKNVIFPRVVARDFRLDSVIFVAAKPGEGLRGAFAAQHVPAGFTAVDARDFRTASGVEALRFALRPGDPGRPPLARLLFRNRRGQVVCVGVLAPPAVADRVFRSVSLLE